MEVSSICNLRCSYCPTGQCYDKIPRQIMPNDLLNKAIEEMAFIKGVKRVTLYIGGEPLINKDLAQIIKKISSKIKGIHFDFVSNGMLISEKIISELAQLNEPILISISVDGRNPKENDKYRVGSNYKILKQNILKLRESLPQNFIIKISNVIVPTEIDLGEKPKVPEFLIKDFGSLLTQKYGFFEIESFYAQIWPGLEDGNYTKKEHNNKKFCTFPFEEALIRANGDLILCCYDLNSDVLMGNLYNDTLLNLMNSDKYKQIRKVMIKGNLNKEGTPKICKACVFNTGEVLLEKTTI